MTESCRLSFIYSVLSVKLILVVSLTLVSGNKTEFLMIIYRRLNAVLSKVDKILLVSARVVLKVSPVKLGSFYAAWIAAEQRELCVFPPVMGRGGKLRHKASLKVKFKKKHTREPLVKNVTKTTLLFSWTTRLNRLRNRDVSMDRDV